MSLYATPEEHAANPPETWSVEKRPHGGDVLGRWKIVDANGTTLDFVRTKAEGIAQIESRSCFSARLWEQERRWYAGEKVEGWKPYVRPAARIPTAANPCRRNSADLGLSVCKCEYCEQQADMAQNDVPMAHGPMLTKPETAEDAAARFARYVSPTPATGSAS